MFSLRTKPVGRLFWKLFFVIWLAQLTAVLGVGTVFWMHRRSDGEAMVSVAEQGSAVQAGDVHRYVPFTSPRDRRFDEKPPIFPGGRSRPGAPLLPVVPVVMGLLTSLLFSAGLAWYLSKPIRHLRAAFKSLASGQLDTRVELAMGRRRDELADLGREFDHMAHRIGTLMVAQRRLLHDVSHELRSPLARLHAAVGLARQQPDKTGASLDRIEREAGRLDELVGEVLTLSRLEAGVTGSPPEEIDLVELLESIIDDARFEAAAKDVTVEYAGIEEIRIKGHAELILRAIENILRNAVKHTPQGETVRVETDSTSDGRVHLRIIDQGPGVPEAQLASIFEPFFRGGGDTQSGFGLGLAIARRAVEVHGGSILARSRPEGGLRIEIVLPVEISPRATNSY